MSRYVLLHAHSDPLLHPGRSHLVGRPTWQVIVAWRRNRLSFFPLVPHGGYFIYLPVYVEHLSAASGDHTSQVPTVLRFHLG